VRKRKGKERKRLYSLIPHLSSTLPDNGRSLPLDLPFFGLSLEILLRVLLLRWEDSVGLLKLLLLLRDLVPGVDDGSGLGSILAKGGRERDGIEGERESQYEMVSEMVV